MGTYSNTAVRRQTYWDIQLLKHRAMGLHSCGNIQQYSCRNTDLLGDTAVDTQSYGATQLWEHRAVGKQGCTAVGIYKNGEHRPIEIQLLTSHGATQLWEL